MGERLGNWIARMLDGSTQDDVQLFPETNYNATDWEDDVVKSYQDNAEAWAQFASNPPVRCNCNEPNCPWR